MATKQVAGDRMDEELPDEVLPFYEACRERTDVNEATAAAAATYAASRRLAPSIDGKRSQQAVADRFGVHQTAVSHYWRDADTAVERADIPDSVDAEFWDQIPGGESDSRGTPAFDDLRQTLHYLVGEPPESKAFWEEICGTDDPREQLAVLEDEFGLTPRHEDPDGDFSVQIASQSPDAYRTLIDSIGLQDGSGE